MPWGPIADRRPIPAKEKFSFSRDLTLRGKAALTTYHNTLKYYDGQLIAPSTIISEACYMLNTYLGLDAEMSDRVTSQG